MFDFLREIVGKVPDLGGSDAAGEESFTTKRRLSRFLFNTFMFSVKIFKVQHMLIML